MLGAAMSRESLRTLGDEAAIWTDGLTEPRYLPDHHRGLRPEHIQASEDLL
jgi:hypothetical protein